MLSRSNPPAPTRLRAQRFAWSCLASAMGLGAAPLALAAPAQTTAFIKLDQFGYLPASRKVAVVADPQQGANANQAFNPGTGAKQYEVRRWADDVVVFSGTLQAWQGGATHAQSGDRGWWLDFSSLKTAGSYYLYDVVNQVGSGRFEIGKNVYADVLKQALRMFYHQRLGMAHLAKYAGTRWADGASYQGANQDRFATSRYAKGDMNTAKDLSGGWMDAGDTNKYTTFAQEAVLQLLEAYRLNPAVFTDALGIPESGNGLPDLLDELKWELDFLKRMQDATGSNGFLLKVGLDTYEGSSSPPSSDTRPRYYLPECTSATLAGTAMLASAAVVFKSVPSQLAYGSDLLARAELAWARAKTTTSNFSSYQTSCDDGDIKAGDADVSAQTQLESAFIAAVYLYEATGKAEYRSFVESRYSQIQPYSIQWWGPYWLPQQQALLRYAGLPGVSAMVASNIRSQKASMNSVDSLNDDSAGTDLYRAYLADAEFNWGHNKTRSNAGNLNLDFVSYAINSAQASQYRAVAEQHLHWLHGANPLGLVMLSNMGAYGAESSVNEIYHTWFGDGTPWDNAQTSPKGPPPGYVPGGPNKTYSGSVAGISDQPPQKAYRDWNTGWPENSWEITEPAIYYQAAYVMLLSRVMAATSTPPSTDTEKPSAPGVPVIGSRSASSISLSWDAATDNVGVASYSLYNGSSLLQAGLSATSTTLTGLACASSFKFKLKALDAAGNASAFSTATSAKTRACQSVSIYTDALASGWEDWSWNATRNFQDASQHQVGSYAMRADLSNWGGLSLRHVSGLSSAGVTLSFWVYSAQAAPLRIFVQSADAGAEGTQVSLTTTAGVWQQVQLSAAQLGNPALIKRLNFQLASADSATVYLDQIELLQ
jgi:endoglucanase